MHPALVAQFLVDVLALDREHDLLEPAPLAAAAVHHLDLPALRIGVAAVHPEQVGREQRRFLATRPAADLNDRVARVVRVRRDQAELDGLVEFPGFGPQIVELGAGQLRHLRIVAFREFLVLGNLLPDRFSPVIAIEQIFQPLMLPAEFRRAALVGIDVRLGQFCLQLI